MIKYSKGKGKIIKKIVRRIKFSLKCLTGFCFGYKIHRPDVDHTVYEQDNKYLLSTFKSSAKIFHSVSQPQGKPLKQYQIIEIEHPFAITGHLNHESDYRLFRQKFFTELANFFLEFDTRYHRIIANSNQAISYLDEYLNFINSSIPQNVVHQIYWGLRKKRTSIEVSKKLSVFHNGGIYPYSKGTKDVIDLARKFPSVKFYISVDLKSCLVRENSLPNIEYLNVWSKEAYLRGFGSSSVLLLPLYGDGWGAPLEALSYAMPIIGYNTFDKKEVIVNNENGFLIDVPKALSFYDSFFEGEYNNWTEYNQFIADSNNKKQLDGLCVALDLYCSRPELILQHSLAASELFDRNFSSEIRLPKIRQVYDDLLGKKKLQSSSFHDWK
jgi:glycosyltransferase involved in cell wall biosynthesis